MVRRSERRFSLARVRVVNRTQLAVIVALLTVATTWALPRFYPAAMQGPACESLAPPIGGNNRSVLAYRTDQATSLDLRLILDSQTLRPNEPLRLNLVFVNESRGPMVLHLPRQEPVITADRAAQGIALEITSVFGGVALANQPSTYFPPAAFIDTSTLHLLSSRARCHMSITVPYSTLASLGLQPGQEYRIRAYYRNASDGDLVAVTPINATATPFPEYANSQGVWVGEASSGEERFSVLIQ